MAYNNYYPQNYYQPYYPTQNNAQNAAQNAASNYTGGIIWVQGEAAAKAFPVGSGQSVLLMDSEDSIMYIKSTDQSGMPQPLRIFEYKERTTKHNEAGAAKASSGDFVSRSEFEDFRNSVEKSIKNLRKAEKEEGVG